MNEYHIHHIIPKHMGGSDDPSNLKKMTIEEHANAHLDLYKKHGNNYDLIAFKSLSKQIGHQQARLDASHEAQRIKAKVDPEWAALKNKRISESLMGKESPKPEDFGAKISKLAKENNYHLHMKETWGHRKGHAPANKGKFKWDVELVLKLHDEGNSWAEIKEKTGCPPRTSQRYVDNRGN